MKLLVLTQKVDKNDGVLGFFHNWIEAMSKEFEEVMVVALGVGDHKLPSNVKAYSLGKEKGASRLSKIIKFYGYILKFKNKYDSVFVHMNPEYVVLGGLFWKLWKKRVGLWYVHKAVNLKLRVAEKFVDKIFTVAKESFRLRNKKIVIVGHGIAKEKCKTQNEKWKIKENLFKVVYVGRISPIKNQKLLAEAADILVNREKIRDIKFKFIGAPIVENDKIYFNELTNLAAEKNISQYLEFAGTVPHEKIFEEYDNSDLSINLCPTGGLDKAVLESMARGCLVFAYNKAFENILPKELILNTSDKNELAEKIKWAINLKEDYRNEIRKKMIKEIEKNHNLDGMVKRILEVLCD